MRDRLLRLPGVGGVNVFGGGNYSMRVWIDPDRAAGRDLTSSEIVSALRAQNVPVAEIRVRAPRLETLYLDALRPRELTDPEAAPLRAGTAG